MNLEEARTKARAYEPGCGVWIVAKIKPLKGNGFPAGYEVDPEGYHLSDWQDTSCLELYVDGKVVS